MKQPSTNIDGNILFAFWSGVIMFFVVVILFAIAIYGHKGNDYVEYERQMKAIESLYFQQGN